MWVVGQVCGGRESGSAEGVHKGRWLGACARGRDAILCGCQDEVSGLAALVHQVDQCICLAASGMRHDCARCKGCPSLPWSSRCGTGLSHGVSGHGIQFIALSGSMPAVWGSMQCTGSVNLLRFLCVRYALFTAEDAQSACTACSCLGGSVAAAPYAGVQGNYSFPYCLPGGGGGGGGGGERHNAHQQYSLSCCAAALDSLVCISVESVFPCTQYRPNTGRWSG